MDATRCSAFYGLLQNNTYVTAPTGNGVIMAVRCDVLCIATRRMQHATECAPLKTANSARTARGMLAEGHMTSNAP